MATSGNLDNGNNLQLDSWNRYLTRVMAETKGDDLVWYRIAEMIRDTLLSTNESRAAEGAKRIDSYYRYEYFTADPLLKFLEGNGTAPFLCHFYSMVLDVSSTIPAADPNQDALAQLLVELRKLPPTSCMIWNDRSLIQTKEPVLATVLETVRRSNRPRLADDDTDESLQIDCDEWTNICAFIARCIDSGLLDQYDSGCGYALYDITRGLQRNHPVEMIEKCFATVAINYFLFAGPKIYHELVLKPWNRSDVKEGLDKWLDWTKGVKEIVDSEDAGSELGRIAREAHGVMISLHPEEH